FYFFASLAGRDTVGVDEYTAAGGGDVFARASGQAWAGDRICVLQPCVDAAIDNLNKAPLSASGYTRLFGNHGGSGSGGGGGGGGGGDGGPPIPLSRETL